MQRRTTRLIVWLTTIAVLIGSVGGDPAGALAAAPAPMQGRCVEPDDDFQSACTFRRSNEMVGTIEHPDDVDAYRFVAMDFDTVVHVTLSDLPAPYEAYVYDWRRDQIASSVATGEQSQFAQAALHLPGTYYVFVRSRTGQFSQNQDYHLNVTVDNGGRPARRIVFLAEIDPSNAANERRETHNGVEYIRTGGKNVMNFQKAGTPDAPATGTITMLFPAPPVFAYVFDARVASGAHAGVRVLFGESKESNGRYVVIVDVTQNRVGLFHQAEGGAVTTLVDYLPIDAADQQGGINHVSLQVVGGQLRVNLNGKDILQHAGLKVVEGQVSIGAISWDGPASVIFDNELLVAEVGA